MVCLEGVCFQVADAAASLRLDWLFWIENRAAELNLLFLSNTAEDAVKS